MAQPTKSSSKAKAKPAAKSAAKKAAPKTAHAKTHGHAPVKMSAPTPGLHYNKDDLHADYTKTYSAFMKALAIGVLGALVYFFVMIIYLGARGHTPTDDYVREFGSRIQYDYKGLRLPEYDDPSLLDKKPTEKEAH